MRYPSVLAKVCRKEPQPEEPVTAIDMRVYVTRAQMVQLKQFLKDNGIQFGPVPQQ